MQRRRYYNNNLNYPTSSPMLSASFMDGRWKQFHRGRERRGERNPTIIITYQNSPQISKRWSSHKTSHRNKMFIITIPIAGHDKKTKTFRKLRPLRLRNRNNRQNLRTTTRREPGDRFKRIPRLYWNATPTSSTIVISIYPYKKARVHGCAFYTCYLLRGKMGTRIREEGSESSSGCGIDKALSINRGRGGRIERPLKIVLFITRRASWWNNG